MKLGSVVCSCSPCRSCWDRVENRVPGESALSPVVALPCPLSPSFAGISGQEDHGVVCGTMKLVSNTPLACRGSCGSCSHPVLVGNGTSNCAM